MDAREQLLVDERAREAVVRPGERAHARGGIGAAEDDDGAVRHETAVERVGVAEQQDVRVGRPGDLLGPLVGEHVEAVVAELALEEAAHGRLGLGKKKCSHAAEATRSIRTKPSPTGANRLGRQRDLRLDALVDVVGAERLRSLLEPVEAALLLAQLVPIPPHVHVEARVGQTLREIRAVEAHLLLLTELP
jgi:hypothetical protein